MGQIGPANRPAEEVENNVGRQAGESPGRDGGCYEIKVRGHLEVHWSERLGGLRITHDARGSTCLAGSVADQAALHGILTQIRDLGLTLLSLTLQEAAAGQEE